MTIPGRMRRMLILYPSFFVGKRFMKDSDILMRNFKS
jgi:hypothetical protein